MTSIRRVAVTLTALAAACGGSEDRSIGGSAVGESDVRAPGGVEVSPATHHDVSGPLRDAAATPAGTPTFKEHKVHPLPQAPATPTGDPALQATVGPLIAVTPGLNFAGVGNGDYGFAPNAAPPDTNGAVGATQYVQWVNESFAVFDKTTGAIAAGFPKAGNTLWNGFGGVVSRMREKRNAVPEMKGDPSKPACRRGFQTAVSCCGSMTVVVNVTEK